MVKWRRNILILIILLIAMTIPRVVSQTQPQLSLFLVGENTEQYVAPAGQSSMLKMEILNTGRSDVYLLEGEAFLDPDLSGTWELVHSEALGSFHLSFLQSAIWTFDLTVPANIRAANATNGTPQVNLLVKIVYQTVSEAEHEEQIVFELGVPGATVQQTYDLTLYALAGVFIVACVGASYIMMRRRRIR